MMIGTRAAQRAACGSPPLARGPASWRGAKHSWPWAERARAVVPRRVGRMHRARRGRRGLRPWARASRMRRARAPP
eukprot:3272908-Prymnesium_polylepis.1